MEDEEASGERAEQELIGEHDSSFERLLERAVAAPPIPVEFRKDGAVRRVAHLELREVLGAGGGGVVYRAFDTSLEREVAVKRLVAPRSVAHAEREARLAAQLVHPNVASVHGIVREGADVYLVFELVLGSSLAEVLGGPGLSPMRGLQVAREVLSGAAVAHERGITHADIKPGNVMIARNGAAKLVDFGLARVSDADASSGGTPGYIAPEVVGGERPTPRSDVYSLGRTIEEILQGHSSDDPRRPRGPTARRFPVSFWLLRRVLLRALDPNPSVRPASALELLRAFDRALRVSRGVAVAAIALLCGAAWLVSRVDVPASTEASGADRVLLLRAAREHLESHEPTKAHAFLRSVLCLGDSPAARALLDRLDAEPLVVRHDWNTVVRAAVFSEDGTHVWFGDRDGVVHRLSVATEIVEEVVRASDQVLSAVRLPDGRVLFSSFASELIETGEDETVVRRSTRDVINQLVTWRGEVFGIAAARPVAVRGEDETLGSLVAVRDAFRMQASGSTLCVSEERRGLSCVNDLGVSADVREVRDVVALAGADDGMVLAATSHGDIYRVSGKTAWIVGHVDGEPRVVLALGPRSFVVGTASQEMSFFDGVGLQPRHRSPSLVGIPVAVDRVGGRWLVAGTSGVAVYAVDATNVSMQRGHEPAWDAEALYAVALDGDRVWTHSPGRLTARTLGGDFTVFAGPAVAARDIVLETEAVWLLDGPDRVVEFDPVRGRDRSAYYVEAPRGHLDGLVVREDGEAVFAGTQDGRVLAWNQGARSNSREWSIARSVRSVTRSGDQLHAASSSGVFEIESRADEAPVQRSQGDALDVDAWNGWVTASYVDGLVEAIHGDERRSIRLMGRVHGVSVRGPLPVVAIATSAGAFLWQPREDLLLRLEGHHGEVNAVAMTNDAQWVATVGDDGAMRWFDRSGAPRWWARGVSGLSGCVASHHGVIGSCVGNFMPRSDEHAWASRGADVTCRLSRTGLTRVLETGSISRAVDGASHVVATARGCVALAPSGELVAVGEEIPAGLPSANVLAPAEGPGFLLASGRRVFRVAAETRSVVETTSDVSAIFEFRDRLWVGTTRGELHDGLRACVLQSPGRAPIRFVGDLGGRYLTFGDAVGYATIFDSETCETLESTRVMGAVVASFVNEGTWTVVSDVADLRENGVRWLFADRDEALRHLRSRTSLIWMGGEFRAEDRGCSN